MALPGAAAVIVLAVLVVLVLVLLTAAFRLARWSNRTRHLVEFQGAVAGIAAEADASLRRAAEAVDSVRRGSATAIDIVMDLGEALTASAALADRTRGLGSPAGTDAVRAGLLEELERAGRALEMVEHGCRLQTGARGREHEPEAQIAIKRGYLNLLHARESIGRHAAAAAALQVTVPRFLARRPAD